MGAGGGTTAGRGAGFDRFTAGSRLDVLDADFFNASVGPPWLEIDRFEGTEDVVDEDE